MPHLRMTLRKVPHVPPVGAVLKHKRTGVLRVVCQRSETLDGIYLVRGAVCLRRLRPSWTSPRPTVCYHWHEIDQLYEVTKARATVFPNEREGGYTPDGLKVK